MNRVPSRRYKNVSLGRKLEVKSRTNWTELERNQTDVSIEISMQNVDCSGNSLELILEWIGSGWHSTTLSVGDSLHRFNIFVRERTRDASFSMQDAKQSAIRLGDNWLDQNSKLLGEQGRIGQIKRWQDWLAHPKFEAYFSKFLEHYNVNPNFRRVVASDIQGHNARQSIDVSNAIDIQAYYILEEATVYFLQNTERPCIHIYPGSKLKTLGYLEDHSDLSMRLSRHYAYVQISRNV